MDKAASRIRLRKRTTFEGQKESFLYWHHSLLTKESIYKTKKLMYFV